MTDADRPATVSEVIELISDLRDLVLASSLLAMQAASDSGDVDEAISNFDEKDEKLRRAVDRVRGQGL